MSFGEVERMLSEAIKIERLVLGEDKKDQGRFTEFRIFIGTHYNPDEEGYGKPQQYKEWLPEPTIEGDEDDEEEGGR